VIEPVAVGLKAGESVRWRRRANERWSTGRLVGIESDGSLRVVDDKGAARSLAIESVEVKRSKTSWEPASARAERTEQLGLL
jgi:hypothetical protein